MLLSIIIPMYNVESLIEKTLLSIIEKSDSNVEIVVVDDGSTDGSALVVEEVMKQYPEKIQLIKKSNAGVSSARNFGIVNAIGEYVTFLDSDDIVHSDFQSIVERITRDSAAIYVCKVKVKYKDDYYLHDKCNYKNHERSFRSFEDASIYLIKSNQFLQSVYAYIIKKELLLTKKILFNEKYRVFEDFDFIIKLILGSKDQLCKIINKYFCIYHKGRPNQITYGKNLNRDINALKVMEFWYNNKSQIEMTKDIELSIKTYIANSYFLGFGNQYMYAGVEKETRYNEFKKLQYMRKNVRSRRLVPFVLLSFIVGVKISIWLLTNSKLLYRKLRNRIYEN